MGIWAWCGLRAELVTADNGSTRWDGDVLESACGQGGTVCTTDRLDLHVGADVSRSA